jgi:hypothetical protein
MRVDPTRQLLSVDVRGRLTTEEALRAVSQGFTLAEASRIRGIFCDLSGLNRGPGGMLIVSAALASRFHPDMRMAFIGNSAQLNVARRLIRFSGVRSGLATFDTVAEADEWLAPALAQPKRRLTGTALRHAERLLAATHASDDDEATPAARARRSSPAA